MSANGAIEYVKVNDNGTTEVMPDGYINTGNIDLMKFHFEKPRDITNSFKHNNKLNNEGVDDTIEHRTAYGGGECEYPDGNRTAKIVLEDVIIQYREGIAKKDDTKYGRTYVCIGIPLKYNKICSDANTVSSVKLKIKDKYEPKEGHFWLDCNLDKLTPESVYVIDGEGNPTPTTLFKMLKGGKTSFKAHIFTAFSATATDDDIKKKMNLDRTYNLALKPYEIFLVSKTKIVGPTLAQIKKRETESTAKGEKFLADDDLVAIAMQSINM